MSVESNAWKCVVPEDIVRNDVPIILSAGRARKHAHTCSLTCNQTVSLRHIPDDGVVVNAERRIRRWMWTRLHEMVRCDSDPAVKRIVLHGIAGNQIVVIRTGIIADENSTCIVIDQIIRHSGMVHSA